MVVNLLNNPPKGSFNICVEIGKIHNLIVKSTKKLTEESTKKSIIDDVKKLLKVVKTLLIKQYVMAQY